MTTPAKMRHGIALRAYLAISYVFALVAKPILRRRLARGKEHSDRWPEKLGLGLSPRPTGPLIWLHAVGLGEVLSLRGLIDRLGAQRADVSFLVTSTTATSASAFAKQAPARTLHQFLPLDAPQYRKRFLNHFAPDLCVWVEQDLWPGFVSDLAASGVPQCVVAARMNDTSATSHQRIASVYRDLYQAMELVTAQDDTTAANLADLGATPTVTGSLKPAAPALSCDSAELAKVQTHLNNRFVWAVAPAHPEDCAIAMTAHETLRLSDPSALLIVVPRFLDKFADIDGPRRSKAEFPSPNDAIWLCDTMGELGLVYRIARAVLIGGTFSNTEGHNPWEAAALNCAILHGPRTANFKQDFVDLNAANAALPVKSGQDVAQALSSADLDAVAKRASKCSADASQRTDALATQLIHVLEAGHEG